MRRRTPPVEQSGLGDDLGAGTYADNLGALFRLAPEPGKGRWIVVATHGRHDHVVRSLGMRCIELGNGRIRLDPKRGIELNSPQAGRHHHDIRNIGASENACRHQIVGGLRGVVQAEHRDQGTRPPNRPQRIEHCAPLLLRNG
jgi:hypothetical protein